MSIDKPSIPDQKPIVVSENTEKTLFTTFRQRAAQFKADLDKLPELPCTFLSHIADVQLNTAYPVTLSDGTKIDAVMIGPGKDQLLINTDIKDINEKYYELLYAVGRKFPGETRHETALRYIRSAEIQDIDTPNTAGERAD